MAKTNKAAAERLRAGFIAMTMTYEGNKTKEEKARIKYSANVLYEEYNRVVGRSPSENYADITKKLASAQGRLLRIKEDRDRMANNLITAAQIQKAITGLVELLA